MKLWDVEILWNVYSERFFDRINRLMLSSRYTVELRYCLALMASKVSVTVMPHRLYLLQALSILYSLHFNHTIFTYRNLTT